MDYESLVLTSVAIAVGSTEAKSVVVNKKLAGAPIIAGFGLGVFLFIIGLARQDIGVKFCYLIIVAALLTNGAELFAALAPQKKG